MKTKNVFLVFVRTVVSQTLGLLRSFLIIPFLSVSEFGMYRYIVSVLGYANYFNMGTVALLSFKYPFHDAAKNKVEADKVQHLVRTMVVIGCIVFFGFLVVFFVTNSGFTYAESLLFAVVCCFMSMVPYFSMYYRVRFDYGKMVTQEMIATVLSFLCFIILGYYWGLSGFIIGFASTGLIALMINFRTLAMPAVTLNSSFFKENIAFSILLGLSGAINQFMITGDLILIKNAGVLVPDHFGLYAFCATIATMVPSYMGSFTDVDTQELLRFLGARHGSSHEMKNEGGEIIERLEKLILRDFVIATGLATAVFFMTNLAVLFFFPKYLFALQVLGAFMVGSVVLRWRTYPVFFMNHLKRTNLANISSFIAVGLMIVSIYFTWYFGMATIHTLAWVSFVSYFTCSVFSIAAIFRHYDQLHRLLPFLKQLIVLLLPSFLFASAYVIDFESPYILNLAGGSLALVLTFLFVKWIVPSTYGDILKVKDRVYQKVTGILNKFFKS